MMKLTERQQVMILFKGLEKVAEELVERIELAESFYLDEIKQLGGDPEEVKWRVENKVIAHIYRKKNNL